ncbi:MAG: 4Fe-4S binding protein [Coriobacteriia bacterium]|nr:4Fe-4S binding protein [Coriobacteriia bacterium]
MSIYGFYFDGTRCTACKTCVYACKDKNDLNLGFAYRRVFEYTGGDTTRDGAGAISSDCFTYSVSVSCNHCDNAVCIEVCPTAAMHRDPQTGLICVDSSVCIGCGYCALSCPYRAPKVDRAKGHSVKCDGCNDLIKDDKAPVCILACPTRALGFGKISELQAKGEQVNIAPLPEKDYTLPNMYIKPSKDARPVGTDNAFIANPLEVL